MKKKLSLLLMSSLSLLIYGCSNDKNSTLNDTNTSTNSSISTEISGITESNIDSDDKDSSYDASKASSVLISDTTSITNDGTYILTGTYTEKVVTVDTDGIVKLVLSSFDVTNTTFAPIYIKSADHVYIVLEGTNSLKVTDAFAPIDDNNVDGVIYSKDDLTIQGNGKLNIESSKHGIVAKDDFIITGGEINISASNHGIDVNDSVNLSSTTLNITSIKDGIHVENEDDTTKGYLYMESGIVTINSGYDGIDSSSIVQIDDGTVNITSGGGSNATSSTNSTKGIKANSNIVIIDGDIDINSLDDSIHSNGSIEIKGGDLDLASGDDGVHADTSLIINGGDINISKSYEGLEGQNITINDGNISVISSDDGLNAAGGNDSSSIGGRPGQNSFNSTSDAYININGGTLYVNATGDGIDSNGNLTVTGGYTLVEGPTSAGDGPLDYDGTGTINGGTFIAIGSSGMAMNFSTATQGSILLNTSSTQSKGTKIILSSSSEEIINITSSKTFQSVLVSSPKLETGNTYTLKIGSTSNSINLSTYIYGSNTGGGFNPGGGKRP